MATKRMEPDDPLPHRLSEFLLEKIRQLDEVEPGEMTDEEEIELRDALQFVSRVAEILLESRYEPTDRPLPVVLEEWLRTIPGEAERLLDEHFTHTS